jgi:TetR/AcrR family transcriptional regulator, cholesterol catabolism regulator
MEQLEQLDIKKKILKAAENLFMKYGVRSISMDDISRHLSVSKKTLYQHFADKEDIVSMTCQAHIESMANQFLEITKNSKNAIDELAKISRCLKQNTEDTNPSLLFDLQKYHPKAWSVWVNHKNKFIRESVIRNLKQGIEEGYYRPELNVDIIAAMRIELVQLPFDDEIFPTSKYKIAEVQMHIFDHFVNGILTDKGRKLYQKYKDTLSNNT